MGAGARAAKKPGAGLKRTGSATLAQERGGFQDIPTV